MRTWHRNAGRRCVADSQRPAQHVFGGFQDPRRGQDELGQCPPQAAQSFQPSLAFTVQDRHLVRVVAGARHLIGGHGASIAARSVYGVRGESLPEK